MKYVYTLYRIDFCGLENGIGDAISKEKLKVFLDNVNKEPRASVQINKYLKTLEVELYKGWDGEIYPKFELEENMV